MRSLCMCRRTPVPRELGIVRIGTCVSDRPIERGADQEESPSGERTAMVGTRSVLSRVWLCAARLRCELAFTVHGDQPKMSGPKECST